MRYVLYINVITIQNENYKVYKVSIDTRVKCISTCVNAEHSTYLMARNSLASFSAYGCMGYSYY